jgi:sulfur-carrier protein
MDIELELFGALRGLEPGDRLQVPVAGWTVADLRAALAAHAAAHWPRVTPGLLGSCAFATPSAVLRDGEALPADGRMVVLPPVSGG